MEPSAQRWMRLASGEARAKSTGEQDADLVRWLHDALGRLGVEVRVEPMPEEARLQGGYCVVHGKPAIFLSPTASLAEQREALLDALRALGTEHLWLPPAVRALIEDR